MLDLKGTTYFRSPLEHELYLELLGAEKTKHKEEGRPVYKYGNILISTDREYSCIYCDSNYGQKKINYEGKTLVMDKTLSDLVLTTDEEKEMFSCHFYGNLISTLEGLVYAIAKLYHQDNLEEYFNETLKTIKTQALLKTFENLDSEVLNCIKIDDINPAIKSFMKVINMSSEEASRFSDVFLFNTTGVYRSHGFDNKLKFIFWTPDDTRHYEIHSYGDDSWDLYTSVDNNGYLGIKIRDAHIYIVKMKENDYRIWDLINCFTCKGFDFGKKDCLWTIPTPEEKDELDNILLEINNSTSLIDSDLTLNDEKKSRK